MNLLFYVDDPLTLFPRIAAAKELAFIAFISTSAGTSRTLVNENYVKESYRLKLSPDTRRGSVASLIYYHTLPTDLPVR